MTPEPKDYTRFTADDFIADEYFQQWVLAPTPAASDFWSGWRASHPEKESEIRQAVLFLQNLQFHTADISHEQVEQSLARNLAAIDRLEDERSGKVRMLRWMAAAGIMALVALGAWFFTPRQPVTIELATGAGEIKTVVLPDSSVITLNAHSSLRYSSGMQKAAVREVWMQGEAYFNVRHLEPAGATARPFVVHSGKLKVEVLGTTFNIRNGPAGTNVTLNTGKIKIGLKDDATTVAMQPGDFLRYSPRDKHLLRKKVQPELYSEWKEEKLTLDKLNLRQVATLIEDMYGYTVVIADPELQTGTVSGTLRLQGEAALLETLAFTLDININKEGNTLFFHSKNKN